MRIPYMKPGYVMGPTTGNMLIAVANAFLNLSVVAGTKNDVLISELNSILSLDIANLAANGTGGPTIKVEDYTVLNQTTLNFQAELGVTLIPKSGSDPANGVVGITGGMHRGEFYSAGSPFSFPIFNGDTFSVRYEDGSSNIYCFLFCAQYYNRALSGDTGVIQSADYPTAQMVYDFSINGMASLAAAAASRIWMIPTGFMWPTGLVPGDLTLVS